MIYSIYCPICKKGYVINSEIINDKTNTNNSHQYSIEGTICSHIIPLLGECLE